MTDSTSKPEAEHVHELELENGFVCKCGFDIRNEAPISPKVAPQLPSGMEEIAKQARDVIWEPSAHLTPENTYELILRAMQQAVEAAQKEKPRRQHECPSCGCKFVEAILSSNP